MNCLLSIAELQRYEAGQLAHMEMELLAEHGQVFSNSRWQQHFDQAYWYMARNEKEEPFPRYDLGKAPE